VTEGEVARAYVATLGAQLRRFKEQILEFDRRIWAGAGHGSSPASKGQLTTTSTEGSCDSLAA
jgi:hypothetical protein